MTPVGNMTIYDGEQFVFLKEKYKVCTMCSISQAYNNKSSINSITHLNKCKD